MADTYRYRFGETNPVQCAFKTGVAVQVGDLCYQDENDSYTAKPASSQPWNGTLAQTQQDFVLHFLGVSGQRYDGSNVAIGIKDGLLRIDTTGIFEFNCIAGTTLNEGALVGVDQQAGGILLLDPQAVVAVGNKASAIGRVERSVVSASSVKVRIFSTRLGVINN